MRDPVPSIVAWHRDDEMRLVEEARAVMDFFLQVHFTRKHDAIHGSGMVGVIAELELAER